MSESDKLKSERATGKGRHRTASAVVPVTSKIATVITKNRSGSRATKKVARPAHDVRPKRPVDPVAQRSARQDDPVRRAIQARAMRAIESALQDIDLSRLQGVLEAPTDAGTAARLLSLLAESPSEAVRVLDPLAPAILRGVAAKQDLLARAGGVQSAAAVAELLGISKQAVMKRVQSNALLALPDASGRLQFPLFQFTDSGTLPGLKEVLAAFTVKSPWTRLAVLLDSDEAVGGIQLAQALRAGDIAGVLNVVRTFGT